ncbi:MAG: polynucleotide adenylyltransferase PcnB [Chlamydiota bacterium]
MEPKYYTIEQHLISPEQVDKHAYFLVRKLHENGFAAYIVGGWIRDSLMGKPPKDFDISTSAKPEEIKALFRNCILIGKRFRLAHVRFGKKILEVATFRTGDVENASLILQDNDYGTEKDDVLRRDFTINGLFYDLETDTIIDYVGGYSDAKKRILRTIGPPHARFCQDPVRMLRLLKFQARFNLSVEKKTMQALKDCRKNIIKSSQARIFEEILRMLESGFAAPFIHNLAKYRFLELLLPDLEDKILDYILCFLQIADEETAREHLSRPLLLSCLSYPLFVHNVQDASEESPPTLHEIAAIASKTTEQIFSPFFQIPRKMKGAMTYILTSQCRFTPIQDRPGRRLRIPFDEALPSALKFLEMRAKLQPDLSAVYQKIKKLSSSVLSRRLRKPRKTAHGKNR